VIFGDGHDVADTARGEVGAQVRVVAGALVTADPPIRDTRVERSDGDVASQGWFRRASMSSDTPAAARQSGWTTGIGVHDDD
jgi:hypothetical protein